MSADDSEAVAKARVIYKQLQDDLLAATPLAGMAEWIASGAPPPALALRSQGFSGPEAPAEFLTTNYRLARKAYVRQWGFSIPCAEAVAALRALSPLVEVGAGAGVWTALLRNAGLDIVATDALGGPSTYGFEVGRHAPTEILGAADAVVAHPDRNVFCSWPSQGETWATDMVKVVASGRFLALVLHDEVGITGDVELHETLQRTCKPVGRIDLPQWPGVRDRLVIHQKL